MNSRTKLPRSRKGHLLIEAAIALSILMLALGGIFAFISQSLALIKVVESQHLASFLAAEGIEVVKNIIDTNVINFRAWNNGISNGKYEVIFNSESLESYQDRFLLFDGLSKTYNYSIGEQTPFRRMIIIKNIGSDQAQVNSLVRWRIRDANYEINLEDHFLNWRP